MRLDRSLSECVVRFSVRGDVELREILGRVAPGARLGAEILSDGRAWRVVTAPAIPPADAVPASSQLMTRLRASADVEFVAPVFHHPATRARMLPTDEIVVKLKDGVTRDTLTTLAAESGLAQARAIRGTSDQYLLRLAEPKASDVLEVSRALHRTGRFQWVEPNFIQERERQR